MMFDKQKKLGNVFVILFLFLALGVSSWLVKKTQELNRQAAGDNAKVLLNPDNIVGKIGDYQTVKVIVDTSANNNKVSFVEANLCYGSEIEIENVSTDVNIVDTEAFDKEFVKRSVYNSTSVSGEKCLVISASNGDKPIEQEKSGVLVYASIKFKLVKNGTTKIKVRAEDKNTVSLSGGSSSSAIEISTFGETSVKIGDSGEGTKDNAELLLEGVAKSDKNMMVRLVIDSKERQPDIVVAVICSNDVLEIASADNVVLSPASPFTGIVSAKAEPLVTGADKCWNIAIRQQKTCKCKAEDIASKSCDPATGEIKKGVLNIVDINYSIKKTGDYRIYFDKTTGLTQVNACPIGESKFSVDVAKYGELTGTIAGDVTSTPVPTAPVPTTPVTTGGNVLKFNVLIRGTREKDEENVCAFKWSPVDVTVIDANGAETKVTGVLTKTSDKREVEDIATQFTPVWQIEANLGEFSSNQNLLVLVKVPKHLQAVFGNDKQIGRYVKQVGTIGGLTNNSATTPVFDFTGFRIQPGDVVSEVGYEEGWLNVKDFSSIKNGIGSPSDTACLVDVNGDGVVNAVDASLFLGELAQKYGDKR